jgi:hypothetical protein
LLLEHNQCGNNICAMSLHDKWCPPLQDTR